MTDPTDRTALHEELRRATSGLLGDTIALADEDWRRPSLLPGWSRGHVASHLARQADAVARVVTGVLDGHPAQMYASDEARDAEIEAGADRDGQQLQNDLDTSAAALDALFDRIEATGRWEHQVTLRGGRVAPAEALPLARLAEVVLHRIDLDAGYRAADVPSDTARTLLVAAVARMASRFDTPVRLRVTDLPDPAELVLGPEHSGEGVEVSGSTTELLGWLTGRSTDIPDGAADITLPAY